RHREIGCDVLVQVPAAEPVVACVPPFATGGRVIGNGPEVPVRLGELDGAGDIDAGAVGADPDGARDVRHRGSPGSRLARDPQLGARRLVVGERRVLVALGTGGV